MATLKIFLILDQQLTPS